MYSDKILVINNFDRFLKSFYHHLKLCLFYFETNVCIEIILMKFLEIVAMEIERCIKQPTRHFEEKSIKTIFFIGKPHLKILSHFPTKSHATSKKYKLPLKAFVKYVFSVKIYLVSRYNDDSPSDNYNLAINSLRRSNEKKGC